VLHGLFGMSDNWLTIAHRIARKYTVYLLDQRNHGQSPHSPEFNYRVLAEDLEDFIREHDLGVVRLIGHSMGGKAAMYHALHYPERVDKLVIVDIAPKAYYHPFFERVLDLMLTLDLSRFTTRTAIEEVFVEKIPNPAVRLFILKNLQRTEEGFRWRVNVQSLRDHLGEIFAAIESERRFVKPALFVRGGRSDYILDEDEAAIRSLFPAAELVTIPEGSHSLHADAEEALCRHLREYLQC